MSEYERRINAAIGEGRTPTLQDHLDAMQAAWNEKGRELSERHADERRELLDGERRAMASVRRRWESGELQLEDAKNLSRANRKAAANG